MAKNNNRNIGLLIILLLTGLVIGGFLSSILGKYLPILNFGYSMGVSPHTWDLNIIKLTFGISLKINIFGIIGLAIAYIAYRKI